jgi:hypothetical protein
MPDGPALTPRRLVKPVPKPRPTICRLPAARTIPGSNTTRLASSASRAGLPVKVCTRFSVRTRLCIRLAPRLLSRDAAARYCGISTTHFLAHVAPRVAPMLIGRKRLWDVRAIDRWIDRETGIGEISLSPERWLERLDGDPGARR